MNPALLFESGHMDGISDAQLRFLAESLPQIVWTANPDGSMAYMNKRWFEYTGLTPEETYGELNAAVHPDDLQHYRERWDYSVSTLEQYEVEYRFRASDGTYRWFLGLATPLSDRSGKVIKWVGTCTDIHAQKEAEEKLRTLNEYLETTVKERTAHLQEEIERRRLTEQQYIEQLHLLERMINTLPMAAAAISSSGHILRGNESFAALFSSFTVSGQLIGAAVCDILRAAQEILTYPYPDYLCMAVTSGSFYECEVAASDGRTFLFSCLPTSGEGGGCLLSFQDITQEKRVDSVKSEFMSLASHQLRTPLTSIRWALGRLGRTLASRLQPEEQRLIGIMRESTAAMSDTIRTMLSISRVEAGLQAVTPMTFYLRKFLQMFEELFSDAARIKSIHFSVDADPELMMTTDRLILREILENLLSNAIKYTPEGGSVHVSVQAIDDHVQIVVEDTGVGIPHHQHEKIFSKFFRADNILQLDVQGTGLGLYLVSQLVDVLHGSITFSSTLNEGTSFVMTLPREWEKAERTALQSA